MNPGGSDRKRAESRGTGARKISMVVRRQPQTAATGKNSAAPAAALTWPSAYGVVGEPLVSRLPELSRLLLLMPPALSSSSPSSFGNRAL